MKFYHVFLTGTGILLVVAARQGTHYSTWMLESVIERNEGIEAADGLLSEIQKGLFQESLRAATKQSRDPQQVSLWTNYYERSLENGLDDFTNATNDARVPLDRLCAGRSIIQSNMRPSAYRQVLDALRESVNLQPRNANGGLWYYADPQPPEETYRNLSYSDGMYGFAPFATLWGHQSTDGLNLDSASEQFAILYRHVLQNSTGLIVHGYDASKKAPWANRETGASPIVWGRSMGWYLAGLIDSLEIADMKPELCSHDSYRHMKAILCELCRANVAAALRSANRTGIYGVWQVVDRPGEDKNFVEASATALITYVLAKAMRLGYLGDLFSMDHAAGPEGLGWLGRQSAESPLMSARMVRRVVQELYHETVHRFVVENSAGLLEYHGTSALASLEVAQLDYNYYVTRSRVNNSLIGESAFILASLEVERLDAVNMTD